MYEEPQVIDVDEYVAAVVARREAELEKKKEKKLARSRAWHAAHPERVREYTKNRDPAKQKASTLAWRAANTEKVAEDNRIWREANTDKTRESNKAWHKANPNKASEYSKRWAAANQDKVRAANRRWGKANRERITERRKQIRHANPDKFAAKRRKILLAKYGLTIEKFNELFTDQGQCCKLCSADEPRGGRWAVDHCHTTNIVRGIICVKCNSGIGLLGDDPDIVRKALEYLEQN